MCSIFGSFSISTFCDLAHKNQFRGNFSYSIATIDIHNNKIISMFKDFGEFDTRQVSPIDDVYYIGHVQAPTGGLIKDIHRIHPSQLSLVSDRKEDKDGTVTFYEESSYLWHNGILKTPYIKELNNTLPHSENIEWDTELLHKLIRLNNFDSLSNVDGSFGCVYIYKDGIYTFTNDIVNLYFDNNLNLSSTNCEGYQWIKHPSNTVYKWNFCNLNKDIICQFMSKSSPYFFIGDTNEKVVQG